MSAPTAPPERKCRRCGSADPSIRLVPTLLGPTQWQCQTECVTTPPPTLEQLAAAAVPAPWYVRGDICTADGQAVATVWTVLDGDADDEPRTLATAELIVALRNRAPELIRLAREVERLRPVVDAATNWVENRRGWIEDDPEGRAHEEDLTLIAAVDALDADAPLDPADREDLARELVADLRQPVADTTPAQIVPHSPTRPPYGTPERDTADAPVEPAPAHPDGRWLATWSITGSVEQVVEQARIALAQMANEYADAGPVKLRAELRADGGDPR